MNEALVKRLPRDMKVYSPSEQAWYPDLPDAIRAALTAQAAEIGRLLALLNDVLDDQEGDLDFVKWKIRAALSGDAHE